MKIVRRKATKSGKTMAIEGKNLGNLCQDEVFEVLKFMAFSTWLKMESLSKYFQLITLAFCKREFKKQKYKFWEPKPPGQEIKTIEYKKHICLRAKFTLVFKKFMDEFSRIYSGTITPNGNNYEGWPRVQRNLTNIIEMLKLLTWINTNKFGEWDNKVNIEKQIFSIQSENISSECSPLRL